MLAFDILDDLDLSFYFKLPVYFVNILHKSKYYNPAFAGIDEFGVIKLYNLLLTTANCGNFQRISLILFIKIRISNGYLLNYLQFFNR